MVPKLNISLILVSIVSCIADTSETYLPSITRPLSYNINLIPHLEEGNFTFYGEINVIFEIISITPKIFLHSQELKINKRATLIKNNDATYKPVIHSYNEVTNILTLNFDDVLLSGLYTLHMEFVGNIFEVNSGKNGFIKIPYIEKEENNTVFVTLLKPNHTRRIFPCWDEPALKATFDISVMHDQKYNVLSNARMREQTVEPNGMMWTHFDTTPIMSTYLVGIVIFRNFVHVSSGCFFEGKTVNVWRRRPITPQIGFVHSIAQNITSLLVLYTNIPEKIKKMDHVMVYNYPGSGIEHWGLIIYDELIIYDNRTDHIFQRTFAASLVARELVHQWFGNLVTPSWWSYLWLSEGLVTYFETYFLNKVLEEERLMDFFVVEKLHRSLTLDDGPMQPITVEPNNEIEYDMFSIEVHYKCKIKAPVILRMLHHTITDEVFRKGIRRFLTRHQFGSATPDDLWSAMQSALDESYTVPHKDYRIKEVMDTWTKQKRYPILKVTRYYNTGTVGLSQKCCLGNNDINNNDTYNKWMIPITFATQSNPDFSRTVPVYWLSDWIFSSNSFTIPASDWIIFNVQWTAYYRVFYDTTNWYKIIRYLNSEKYTNIHVLNRAQLIDDAYAFWMEKQLNTSVFLDIINYLSRETDYVVWYPMFRILTSFSPYYPLQESDRFKSHMIAIFDKLLQKIGYEENSNDADTMKILRLDVTKWAYNFDYDQSKIMATMKLNQHLRDPNTYKVPREWQDPTYCFGLAFATRATWDKMFELYRRTQDKKFWEYLSCSEDPDIIVSYLNILAANRYNKLSTKLFDDETDASMFKTIIERHANNGLILGYIFTRLHIKPRLITIDQLIQYFISNAYRNEQLGKLRRYSESYLLYLYDYKVTSCTDLILKRKKYLKLIGDDFKKIWEI